MKILFFVISIIVLASIVYGGMVFIIRQYQITNPSGKSLISNVAMTTFIGLLLILQFGSYDNIPEPIQSNSRIETIQDAEERINNLETYTQHLEIDLNFHHWSVYLLIGVLFFMQSCFSVQIAINLSKLHENKNADF
jgi:hypothetical protein